MLIVFVGECPVNVIGIRHVNKVALIVWISGYDDTVFVPCLNFLKFAVHDFSLLIVMINL